MWEKFIFLMVASILAISAVGIIENVKNQQTNLNIPETTIASYDFDDTSGNVSFDTTGNGHNLILESDSANFDCTVNFTGCTLKLNGTGYLGVRLNNTPISNLRTGYIELDYNGTSGASSTLLQNDQAGQFNQVLFSVNGAGSIYFQIRDFVGVCNTDGDINDGLWHKIKASWDGQNIRVLIDGVLNCSASETSGTALANQPNHIDGGGIATPIWIDNYKIVGSPVQRHTETTSVAILNPSFEFATVNSSLPDKWGIGDELLTNPSEIEIWNLSVFNLTSDAQQGIKALELNTFQIREGINHLQSCGFGDLTICASVVTENLLSDNFMTSGNTTTTFYVKGDFYDFNGNNASQINPAFEIGLCTGDASNPCVFIFVKDDGTFVGNRSTGLSIGYDTNLELCNIDGCQAITPTSLVVSDVNNGYKKVVVNAEISGFNVIQIFLNSTDLGISDSLNTSTLKLDNIGIQHSESVIDTTTNTIDSGARNILTIIQIVVILGVILLSGVIMFRDD